MSYENYYEPILDSFDCIGWVPTVRGSLSLDLLDSELLLGNLDKYLIKIKKHQNFNTSRYILSSSLVTYTDSKYDRNLRSRSFRFFFRGSINDKDLQNDFLDRIKIKEKSENLFKNKELLIGKLSIVLNLKEKLALHESEVNALNDLKELTDKEIVYQRTHVEKAESLNLLQQQNNELNILHAKAVDSIRKIENLSDCCDNFKVWKFDVLLSRDGILFLRNDTNSFFLKDFYKEDSASDYKKNTQMHRIFKVALTYIKYMFHNHYHHHKDNDSFLPVTNLHPLKKTKNRNVRIINHQIENFLQQITKYKRLEKELNCNPSGISTYAKAFAEVFHINGFMSHDDRKKLIQFIDIQDTESKIFLNDNFKSKDFFLTQNNYLAAFTIGISFVVLFNLLFRFYFYDSIDNNYAKSKYIRFGLMSTFFVIGFVIQRWQVKRNLSKSFNTALNNIKRNKLGFLLQNSKLKKTRLSYRYYLYLFVTQCILKFTKLKTEYVTITLAIIISLALIFSYFYYILFNMPI